MRDLDGHSGAPSDVGTVRLGHDRELPIPFQAFGSMRPEVRDVTVDWVDATSPRREPQRANPAAGVGEAGPAVVGRAAVDLPPTGRVILTLGPPIPDDAAAEVVVTRLCRHLCPGPEGDLLDQHAPADDVQHWAAVDAARAVLIQHLDLVVCAHQVTHQDGHQLITVDTPEAHARTLIAAVVAIPGLRIDAILTEHGWARRPVGTSVTAAKAHARRRSGRALVFPGQAALHDDVSLPDLLAGTAIEQVTSVHGPHNPRALVRCYGYARPLYRGGRLVLPVAHDDPMLLHPIETRYTRPCCGQDHR